MKYMSCGFIQYGIEFRFENEIRLCSQVSHIGGGKIYLLKNFDPKKPDIDKVWSNIKNYAKHQKLSHLVNIKYIIVPGINDNEEEINLWLAKCKEAGVHNVVLGIDANYFEPNRNNIFPHIFDLFHKAREHAEQIGLRFYIANRATTMLTKGKYADSFWEKYRYDEGPYTDIYFKDCRI